MISKRAKVMLEEFRKGLPPEPFDLTLTISPIPLQNISFFTPQTIVLEIDSGNGQSYALQDLQKQAIEKGFICSFLHLGQGELPLLKHAAHFLWHLIQSNSKLTKKLQNPILQPAKTWQNSKENEVNLLSKMLGWEENSSTDQTLLQDYVQTKPPVVKEPLFTINSDYQKLLKAFATFSDENQQAILFIDGIEAELEDYLQEKYFQSAWNNLTFLLTQQNSVKCVCALSSAFIHSFSFEMMIRDYSSHYPPQIVKINELDSNYIELLCKTLADLYQSAYGIQGNLDKLYQKAAAKSTIREAVKAIILELDSNNET